MPSLPRPGNDFLEASHYPSLPHSIGASERRDGKRPIVRPVLRALDRSRHVSAEEVRPRNSVEYVRPREGSQDIRFCASEQNMLLRVRRGVRMNWLQLNRAGVLWYVLRTHGVVRRQHTEFLMHALEACTQRSCAHGTPPGIHFQGMYSMVRRAGQLTHDTHQVAWSQACVLKHMYDGTSPG